jgi:hypothetical protein
MPDENAPILNYAPLPPRPRRTKLVLAGAAAGAILLGAGVVIPSFSRSSMCMGKPASTNLQWSATAPAPGSMYQPSGATSLRTPGDSPGYQVDWAATSPSSAPATQDSDPAPTEQTAPEDR